MATRSTIWYKDEDNKCYKGIYCHWDGYLGYNGKILLENYNTLDRVKELISYGFASSISETLDKCEFYHRDREEDFDSYHINSLSKISKYLEQYTYIFQYNKWFILSEDEVLIELTSDLVDSEELI